jgi:hypothetical protein
MSMTTHTDLIAATQYIAAIPESASWYTQRLAERIDARGGLRAMSVAELVVIDADLRAEVARDYAEALA